MKRIFGKLGPAVPAMAVLAAVLAVGLFAVVRDRPCVVSTVLVANDCETAGPASAGLVAGSAEAAGPAHAGLVAGSAEAAGPAHAGPTGEEADMSASGQTATDDPQVRREAHRRTEIRGRRGRVRPRPRGRPQERRHDALDLGADPGRAASDLPPRLRDRGPVLQGAALAGLPRRARHARPLLRQFARHLLSRLFLGHQPARAGRIHGADRPQVLDPRPDLRRGLEGADARLAGPRPPGRPQADRVPRLLERGRLSGRRARYPARRRRLPHGPPSLRHDLLDAAPVERDLAPRPAEAPLEGRQDERRRGLRDARLRRGSPGRKGRRPPRRARILEPPRRPARGRPRGPLRARPRRSTTRSTATTAAPSSAST